MTQQSAQKRAPAPGTRTTGPTGATRCKDEELVLGPDWTPEAWKELTES